MYIRRVELLLMGILLLVVNWFVMSWVPDNLFDTAQANKVTQSTQPVQASMTLQQTAEIPSTFAYQGTLRLADGTLANDTYTMTLRIYDVVTGGNARHTEEFSDVTVRDGVFNLVVGDSASSPLDPGIFTSAPLYLGISVGPDSEMIPRQRLHPVPWAMGANIAYDLAATDQIRVDGKYYGKGDIWLYAYDGDGKDGTAYIRAQNNITSATDIDLQFRTQSNGAYVDALKLTSEGNVDVHGSIEWGGHLGSIRISDEVTVTGISDTWEYLTIDPSYKNDGNSICFLTKLQTNDASGKYGTGCRITSNGPGAVWAVGALVPSSGYDTSCSARCLGW